MQSRLPEICNWTIKTSNNAALTINIENLELDPYEASNAFLEIWESGKFMNGIIGKSDIN